MKVDQKKNDRGEDARKTKRGGEIAARIHSCFGRKEGLLPEEKERVT